MQLNALFDHPICNERGALYWYFQFETDIKNQFEIFIDERSFHLHQQLPSTLKLSLKGATKNGPLYHGLTTSPRLETFIGWIKVSSFSNKLLFWKFCHMEV